MIRKFRPDQPCSSLRPYRWPRSRALGDVQQLNDQMLEVIAEWACNDADSARSLLGRLGASLADLDLVARRRAASVPVLLLDLRFTDVGWWTSAARTAGQSLSGHRIGSPAYPWQTPLTRELLMVVWSALREDLNSAGVLFGISAPVATLIESLTPRQIEVVGTVSGTELKPRFVGNSSFWKRLVASAMTQDDGALTALHVYALQLVAGEILGAPENSTARRRPVHPARTQRALSLATS